ncbi:hypothetical protein [Flavobacterium daemonense]|uniref:hypothetical protein n=1 Tax=Flavobacterium daemonense TaxID=1393049 RepID=UPI00118632E9|nr:hypothetical protein [Flavobacterium daemonense]KAF2327390.1 hypothetical protein FND99_18795 [Flavobacterium daemonense]
MKRHLIFTILLLLLTSCGNIEESSLISNSKNDEKFRIVVTEKHLTEKDSVLSEHKSFKVFDKLNRLINVNDNLFMFYNSNNKLINTKSIFKRKGKGLAKIINREQFYDSFGNLIFILDDNDTIAKYTYDSNQKIIKEAYTYKQIIYEYKDNFNSKKIIIEDNDTSKVSNYFYDKTGKLVTENWTFSKKHEMKSFYKYYSNNKLFSKRDSSYVKTTNPNEYVEFLTEYYYDKNDSIIEIRDLGRVLSENEFKLRGKRIFEYRKK